MMGKLAVAASGPKTSYEAAMARLDQEPDGYPESWKPEPGDKLVATVRRYDLAPSKFPNLDRNVKDELTCWVCVVETRNEAGKPFLTGIWLNHSVLWSKFCELSPQPGEMIAIRRLANADGKGGKSYARYHV